VRMGQARRAAAQRPSGSGANPAASAPARSLGRGVVQHDLRVGASVKLWTLQGGYPHDI